MQWDDLRFVLAVTEEGSAQRAAVTLSVRASTVHRRISAVEESLGVRLFDRLKTGYRPTRLGPGAGSAASAGRSGGLRFSERPPFQ